MIQMNHKIPTINSKQMPLAYSFNVQTPNQLVDIMTDQGVYLPMDIGLNQMANIRFVILTRRLRQIPFDIVKIDDHWFLDRVFHSDLSDYLKQGDCLLIIHKTMITDQLQEEDIFKLILHSPIPFIIWVTWNADTYLKYQIASKQSTEEEAYINAKAYLLKTRDHQQISFYDRLAFLVAHAMQNPQDNMNFSRSSDISYTKTRLDDYSNIQEPPDPHFENDLFANLNRNIHYPILRSDLRPAKDQKELAMVKIHAQLLEEKQGDLLKSKDYVLTAVPHLLEMAYYCSSAGYGLHNTEIVLLWAAMKRLNNQINCVEMKFWGKIFGLYCDYYIVQIQHEEDISVEEINVSNRSRHEKRTLSRRKVSKHAVDIPANLVQNSPTDIPIEPHGIGANQYTYFVCNSPGLPWVKLPDVKPAMINRARQLRRFFTGCLSSQIDDISPDLVSEKDHLRAQIGRITATTHISPAGYYLLAENEEEEEVSFNTYRKDQNIRLSPEFNNDPTNLITAEFLANTNLQEWVHSLPEILPQGRTQFWRSTSPGTTDFSNEAEEEDNEEISDINDIQIPAPLLQPIGDDKPLHTSEIPWSIGLTMSVMHEYSSCYVRSNVWPGAFTVGHAGNFYNLYVGWGQKYEQFHPPQPSLPEMEYAQELIEQDDPTVEIENALEEAQRATMIETTSEEGEEDYEEPFTDEED